MTKELTHRLSYTDRDNVERIIYCTEIEAKTLYRMFERENVQDLTLETINN